jgi:hypothetical protein
MECSDVYADGCRAYDGLVTNDYQHHRVHHHENEFARGKNYVNGIVPSEANSCVEHNLFGVMQSFAWQNFAESDRKSPLFTSKNRSGVSIIEVITFTQLCYRKLPIFPSKLDKTLLDLLDSALFSII